MIVVAIDKIPKEIVDTPIDDLLAVYKVCQEMADLCENDGGIGLAAPQVGIPWRLFVVKNPDGNFEFFVNCDYEPVGDKKEFGVEGCLSLRRNGELRRFRVYRWSRVHLTGSVLTEDENGKLTLKEIDQKTGPDIYNVVYQHETDHTKGILISHIGEEIQIRI